MSSKAPLLFSRAKPNRGSKAGGFEGSKVKDLRIGRGLILLRVKEGGRIPCRAGTPLGCQTVMFSGGAGGGGTGIRWPAWG